MIFQENDQLYKFKPAANIMEAIIPYCEKPILQINVPISEVMVIRCGSTLVLHSHVFHYYIRMEIHGHFEYQKGW